MAHGVYYSIRRILTNRDLVEAVLYVSDTNAVVRRQDSGDWLDLLQFSGFEVDNLSSAREHERRSGRQRSRGWRWLATTGNKHSTSPSIKHRSKISWYFQNFTSVYLHLQWLKWGMARPPASTSAPPAEIWARSAHCFGFYENVQFFWTPLQGSSRLSPRPCSRMGRERGISLPIPLPLDAPLLKKKKRRNFISSQQLNNKI